MSDQKTCPECGEPIDDVRATCRKCGYEYQDGDYTNKDAGSELVTGSAIDEQGNEIPEHDSGN